MIIKEIKIIYKTKLTSRASNAVLTYTFCQFVNKIDSDAKIQELKVNSRFNYYNASMVLVCCNVSLTQKRQKTEIYFNGVRSQRVKILYRKKIKI